MQPGMELFNQLALLLSQDTGSIAPAANPPKLHLSKAAFTPSENTVPGDFVEADFAGYAPIVAIAGNQLVAVDPASNERLVEMKVPAGGWRWQTTALTNLPQSIYGGWLANDAGTIVYGCFLFLNPIGLNAIANIVEVDSLRFRFKFEGVK